MNARTRELFWRRALNTFTEDDAVSWALAELEDAPASPNLSALAGLIPPYNGFEIDALLRKALAERGIMEPPQEEMYRDYLCEMGRRICAGALSPADGCAELARAHGGDMERIELEPFWFLQFCIDDLKAGLEQWYCPDVTLETFDEEVLAKALELVTQNCPSEAAP